MAAGVLSSHHEVVLAYRSEAVGSNFPGIRYQLPFLNEADLVTYTRLIDIVRRHSIDVIISTKPKEYVIGGLVARMTGVHHVIRLGIERQLGDSRLKKWIYHTLNDGILVNAPEVKDGLLKSSFMREEKIAVIFNGINIPALKQKQTAYGVKKPFQFLVGAMGEMSKRKNFETAIQGFAQFVHNTEDTIEPQTCGLLLIGEGERRPFLESMCRSLNIEKQVIFTGFLENPYPYLQHCDVFVSPSYNEGLSNALLEAMVLGAVPVVTDVAGARHAVEHTVNGYCFPMEDFNVNFSSVLADLMHHPDKLRLMAEKSQSTIVNKFNLNRMGDQMIHFLQSQVLVAD